MKTYFIVSDIHAKFKMLINALKKSGFDIENEDHVILFGGDALDRGTEGDSVIRFFESMIEKKRIIGVLGNHDNFLLELINKNVSRVRMNMIFNGFDTTIQLGTDNNVERLTSIELIEAGKNISKKYPVFINWLKELPAYIEFNNHVIVHGFLDFSLKDWHDTDKMFAIWERGYNKKVPMKFEKTLIIGHTPNLIINDKSDIIYANKKILIDGGGAYGGKINILIMTEDVI